MFKYGISLEKAKEIYPKATSFGASLNIGDITMTCFPSDCGALTITGCNYASVKEIAAVLKIASLAGMSKIFGTIVMESASNAQIQKKKFTDAGFTVIQEGFSNRSNYKTDIVLFHYNPKPEKEGY